MLGEDWIAAELVMMKMIGGRILGSNVFDNYLLYLLYIYSLSLPCVNTWAHNYYHEEVLTY